jgi:hypothetical protein
MTVREHLGTQTRAEVDALFEEAGRIDTLASTCKSERLTFGLHEIAQRLRRKALKRMHFRDTDFDAMVEDATRHIFKVGGGRV